MTLCSKSSNIQSTRYWKIYTLLFCVSKYRGVKVRCAKIIKKGTENLHQTTSRQWYWTLSAYHITTLNITYLVGISVCHQSVCFILVVFSRIYRSPMDPSPTKKQDNERRYQWRLIVYEYVPDIHTSPIPSGPPSRWLSVSVSYSLNKKGLTDILGCVWGLNLTREAIPYPLHRRHFQTDAFIHVWKSLYMD